MRTASAPTNVRAAISDVELRELYFAQRLTIGEVAAKFGVAATTISRRMRDLGLDARRRGPVPGTRFGPAPSGPRSFEWSANLAHAVGLITTDGCLGRDGRHLTLTSKDLDLLETARRCLGITARITPTNNGAGGFSHRLQWCDMIFYRWLCDVGLTPAKSLTLGPLAVPDEYFVDFFRGCIDGDGSIVTYIDRYNTFKKPSYVYTRLYVSIVSASLRFLDWLKATVQRLAGVTGYLTVKRAAARNDLWCLKYAKRESLVLLRWMYYAPDVPALGRKRKIAAPFLIRREPPPHRGPGRPMVV